jgi:hypothetical protein
VRCVDQLSFQLPSGRSSRRDLSTSRVVSARIQSFHARLLGRAMIGHRSCEWEVFQSAGVSVESKTSFMTYGRRSDPSMSDISTSVVTCKHSRHSLMVLNSRVEYL